MQQFRFFFTNLIAVNQHSRDKTSLNHPYSPGLTLRLSVIWSIRRTVFRDVVNQAQAVCRWALQVGETRGVSPADGEAKSTECLIAFTAVTAMQLGETQLWRQEPHSLEGTNVKLSLFLSVSAPVLWMTVCLLPPAHKAPFLSRGVRFTPVVKPVTPSARVGPSRWHVARLTGADTLSPLRLIREDEAAVDESLSTSRSTESAGFVQTNSVRYRNRLIAGNNLFATSGHLLPTIQRLFVSPAIIGNPVET